MLLGVLIHRKLKRNIVIKKDLKLGFLTLQFGKHHKILKLLFNLSYKERENYYENDKFIRLGIKFSLVYRILVL